MSNIILPFKNDLGIKVDLNLDDIIQGIYKTIPETTCKNCGTCCKNGCPHIRMCEFAVLFNNFIKDIDPEIKKEVVQRCVENFLSNDVVKPCPLLNKDNGCIVYKYRPSNCKTYGMIDKKEFKKRVKNAKKEFKEEFELLGLKKQCQDVRKDGKIFYLTTEDTDKLMKKLAHLDVAFGAPSVEGLVSYRTFHDWVMLKIFGEEKLCSFTEFKLKATKEAKDSLIKEIIKKLTV